MCVLQLLNEPPILQICFALLSQLSDDLEDIPSSRSRR